MKFLRLNIWNELTAVVLLSLTLSGCNALTRLSQVGEEPPLTAIQNPAVMHNNQPVQVPLPPPVDLEQNANSLWRPGSRAFLKDQRASQVGDIVTVNIEIADSAEISNTTTRMRAGAEEADLSAEDFRRIEAKIAAREKEQAQRKPRSSKAGGKTR